MQTRRRISVAAVAVAAAGWASGAEPGLVPFAYQEGFEGTPPAVTLWAHNGESTEAANGPSAEQAFEGRQCWKLDVTLKGGSYHYWGVPVAVPCAGRLRLSARVRVAPGTTVPVGFGTNMVYPPSRHSGCGAVVTFDKPTDGWQLVEADLVEIGESGKRQVLDLNTVNVSADDAGALLDRWAVFVYGGEGGRAVVYVDDVRVEGEVPETAAYRREIDARFAAARVRFQGQVDRWRQELAQARVALQAAPPAPAPLRAQAEAVTRSADEAAGLIDRLARDGYASPAEVGAVAQALRTAVTGPRVLAALAEHVAAGRRFAVFAPASATANRQPVSGLPVAALPASELACTACAGEHEPMVADLYAIESVAGLTVTVSELSGEAGTIPATAVDTRVLTTWFQGQGGIGYSRERVLKYELLLKDERLLRVDLAKKENYVRSTAPDGTSEYLLCSGPQSDNLAALRPLDSRELQPLELAAGTVKSLWFTVHVPGDAKPGVYAGTVRLAAGQAATSLPLRLTVPPVALGPPRLTYSIYYRAVLAPDGQPTIGSEAKSEAQYRAEAGDLAAHGVLYPTNYQPWDDTRLPRVLDLRREAGLPPGPFFTLGLTTGNSAEPARLEALQAQVGRWRELCARYGYTDLYVYGIDEATGDTLRSQQAAWRTVQQAGAKTFVACYHKTFEAMGKLLDCAVLAGPPDAAEARKWHNVGSRVFCYANPQVGVEEPETYRRNFGLVLWKAGFDGAMDYAYQHGFHHVWNDFDDTQYRDHNFTYPTVDGVIDTVQWEGFREGVDDVRYVSALEAAIGAAPAARQAEAREATAWLAALDPKSADLDQTRATMLEWILRLR